MDKLNYPLYYAYGTFRTLSKLKDVIYENKNNSNAFPGKQKEILAPLTLCSAGSFVRICGLFLF